MKFARIALAVSALASISLGMAHPATAPSNPAAAASAHGRGLAVSVGTTPNESQGPALLNRVVCDNQRVVDRQYWCEITDIRGPAASTVGRVEGDPAAEDLDVQVHQVYNLLGVTYDYYLRNFNYDLTDNIGLAVADDPTYSRVLSATVNVCDGTTPGSVDTCNGDNAFWMPASIASANDTKDYVGGSISIGANLASISDVIAHELQHGVTDAIAGLRYQGQAGAINESISDIFGELVDRTKQIADYGRVTDNWTIGEGHTWLGVAEQPLPFLRSMRDPYSLPNVAPTRLKGQAKNCRGWQPDRMSSPCWDTDPQDSDYGGVHTNSGVGNKTAYLMSEGGTFNGHTIVGMGDANTALLWWRTLPKLTSMADYYELGNDLAATCTSLEIEDLLPAGSCRQTVRPAIAATELANRRVTFSALPLSMRRGAVLRPTVKVLDSRRIGVASGMRGQVAYLQTRSGARWVAVAKATTDFDGIARFAYRVRSAGTYRLAVAANSASGEIGSPRVNIRFR